jgi:hypothetical protein
LLTVTLLLGTPFLHMFPQLVLDSLGKKTPWNYQNVQVAEVMHRQGLQPGERVAYIGFELVAEYLSLDRAHIVAVVPERITHNDKAWGRPLDFNFPNSDEFWRSSPQTQQRVFDAFRSVGAKWVFADTVPPWANITGWQMAGGSHETRLTDRPYTYFRRLQ